MRQQILFSGVKEKIVWKIKFSWCSNFNNLTKTGPRAGSNNSISKTPLSALDFKDTILCWLSFSFSKPPVQSDHYREHLPSPHRAASTGPSDFTSDTSSLGEMSFAPRPSYYMYYDSCLSSHHTASSIKVTTTLSNLLITIVLVTGTKWFLIESCWMNEKEKVVHRMIGRRIKAESKLWCLAWFCLHLIIYLHFKMLPKRVDPLCLCKTKSDVILWLISFQRFPILLKVKYKVLKMSFCLNIGLVLLDWPLNCCLSKLDTYPPQALCTCCSLYL